MAELKAGGLALIMGLKRDTEHNGKVVTLIRKGRRLHPECMKFIEGWYTDLCPKRVIAAYALHPIDPDEMKDELCVEEKQIESVS